MVRVTGLLRAILQNKFDHLVRLRFCRGCRTPTRDTDLCDRCRDKPLKVFDGIEYE